MSKLGFYERDGLASLEKSARWSIILGITFTIIGLFGGFVLTPLFFLAGLGIALLNLGWLFVVLYNLGTGISFRIGRHLATQLGNQDSDDKDSQAYFDKWFGTSKR